VREIISFKDDGADVRDLLMHMKLLLTARHNDSENW